GGVPPRVYRVAPALDGERPVALAVRGERGGPAVFADAVHADALALPPMLVAQDGGSGHGVVALAEHGGGHLEALADHRLGGVAPARDDGRDVEDRDSSSHRGQRYCPRACRSRRDEAHARRLAPYVGTLPYRAATVLRRACHSTTDR